MHTKQRSAAVPAMTTSESSAKVMTGATPAFPSKVIPADIPGWLWMVSTFRTWLGW